MATAILLPFPRAVFFDANGNPLSGGLVHSYAPGGTTPKATWQDAAQATLNSNPIVLDAVGSCLLYGSGSYQLTVTDAFGNAIPGYSGVCSTAGGSGSGGNFLTIAALRASNSAYTAGSVVYVEGYYGPDDGGQGWFIYSATDTTSTDNGGTLIADAFNNRWYRDTQAEPLSVKWFGAKGDGSTDDTAAIQATINAVGANGGGTVWLPVGKYLISSTLTIGNGGAGAFSTVWGIVLRGDGQPIFPAQYFGEFSRSATGLLWGGGAAPMISILGPLQGWGIQNLYLDGAIVATIGINIVSASYGDNQNLSITNCIADAIHSTTVDLFSGADNTDSFQNTWRKLNIWIPSVANAVGILLTGYPNAECDTDMNWFETVFISLPSTGVAAVGVRLQSCDSNTFRALVFTGGSSATVSVMFDYSTSPSGYWPSGNAFYQLDPYSAPGNTQFENFGTPNAVTGPNYIYGLDEGGGSLNPNVANITPSLPSVYPGTSIGLGSQTASIAETTLLVPFQAALYRISYYLAIETAGNNVTVGLYLAWNDGVNNQFYDSAVIAANATNYTTGTVTVLCPISVPLIYATAVSGAMGSGTYQLRIVIERLS